MLNQNFRDGVKLRKEEFMKKKIFLVALAILFVARAFVFAQECLTNNAARVTARGTTVQIINVMNNQRIRVEILYEVQRVRTLRNNQTETTWVDAPYGEYSDPIEPLGRATVTLPTGARYKDYTVWSCN